MYVYRHRIALRADLAIASFCGIVVSCFTSLVLARLAMHFLLPYLMLYIAFLTPESRVLPRIRWDLSYGMYVYAFPIQQAFACTFPGMTWWANLGASLPTCAFCAALSWLFVERPAIRIGRELSSRLDRASTAEIANAS
jgi:peptidoglycan/LPS O-acetylase OafA/YrhL